MLSAVPSVWLVLWGNAVLAGRVSPDEGAEELAGRGGGHRVEGLPEDPDAVSMAVALARLRGTGVSRLSLALPAPGDPLGLGGPAAFTTAAVACGQAVLVPERGLGLLPGDAASTDDRLRWSVTPDVVAAEPGDHLGPAESALRLALLEAADELTDVGRLAMASDRRPAPTPRRPLPPGTDPRAAHLLETADRLLDTVAAALGDESGTITGGQATRRREALRPLERAARRAVVAACAAPVLTRRT